VQCHCNSEMVRISMDPFVREFQPDKYELWSAGLEIGNHPEDELSRLYSRPRYATARPVKAPQQQQTHKYAVEIILYLFIVYYNPSFYLNKSFMLPNYVFYHLFSCVSRIKQHCQLLSFLIDLRLSLRAIIVAFAIRNRRLF